MTLRDLEVDIMRIREAINDMSIQGNRNASLLVYAVDKCDAIIKEIHEISRANEQSQNGVEKEVDEHAGEQNL